MSRRFRDEGGDTPRTDALAERNKDEDVLIAHNDLLDHARALERELAEAHAIERCSADQRQSLDTECARLEAEVARQKGALSDAIHRAERAEAIADPYSCDILRNESGEGWGDGWREIGEQPEGLLPELEYAASRGLIERGTDPKHPFTFRFTKAGKAHL